jgi:uncharacterized protein (DUF1778 family)
MVEPKVASLGGFSRGNRITRQVVPIRLSDAERAQIAGAAAGRELTLSGFIRQAALQLSAVVQEKVVPSYSRPRVPTEQRVVVLDQEPEPEHWVDGDLVNADRCGALRKAG